MALISTYTSANRVVTEELKTTYERELIPKAESSVNATYWKYTRTRTKRYSYVGMTKSGAVAAAQALNRLYNRFIFEWLWNSSSLIWYLEQRADKYGKRIKCGQATPRHESGDAWTVDVEVNETISIPFRLDGQDSSDIPTHWTQFESDPDMRTNAFMGFTPQGTRVDFDYDED